MRPPCCWPALPEPATLQLTPTNGAPQTPPDATNTPVTLTRFKAERSTNGQRFTRIGSRLAAGHSATPHNYSPTGPPPVRGGSVLPAAVV